jgi:hypothetical protein
MYSRETYIVTVMAVVTACTMAVTGPVKQDEPVLLKPVQKVLVLLLSTVKPVPTVLLIPV